MSNKKASLNEHQVQAVKLLCEGRWLWFPIQFLHPTVPAPNELVHVSFFTDNELVFICHFLDIYGMFYYTVTLTIDTPRYNLSQAYIVVRPSNIKAKTWPGNEATHLIMHVCVIGAMR